jgi:hypothetical protein
MYSGCSKSKKAACKGFSNVRGGEAFTKEPPLSRERVHVLKEE